ncbi:heterokaryon incompatibility protein-domain-containing protein [Colletotrichum acutatum]|uniref:Heterokaryon incompatibility protein-domain-containing protein n=1 Tax=Glomerella acutata TaxID=27357 RepID=A0AAD8U482_GLOAC|nr:heterokaryon incompatibility protein-domain-containing protein [Colletotrichum acutatum]KAK1701766.1 heterokaryon incompatibility protein-domain-containing protein [Colletotrichum acutatum]
MTLAVDDPPAYSPPSYASTVYTPLAHSDVVRVLALYPAITHDAEIQCELLSTEISTCQELEQSYVALSYVWGDLSDLQLVYVNDHEVYIGRNLSEALRHLRRRDRPIRLWTDALCINQNDIAERNHQVHQMRNIYSSALETVIYLGDHDGSNTTTSAWNFLERQSEWALNKDGNEDTQLPFTLEEDLIYFRGDVADVELSVLKKAWFLRVWVLQEVVVSKKVSIQCGHRRVPWNDFCKLILLNPRYHDRYGYSMQAIERVDIVRDMFQARCAYQESHNLAQLRPSWHTHVTNYGGRSAHIIDMLARARQLEASDPRDKIFALLGISTNVDLDNRLMAVDYGKSKVEVQTDLARYIMEEHKSLDILSYVIHSINGLSSLRSFGQADALPSWVPDWDASQVTRGQRLMAMHAAELNEDSLPLDPASPIVPTILTYLSEEKDEERERRQDMASKSMAWLNDNKILLTMGSVIGTVTHAGPDIRLRGADELSFQAIRNQCDDPTELRQKIMARWARLLLQKHRRKYVGTHDDSRLPSGPSQSMDTVLRSLGDTPDFGSHTIESHLFSRGRQTAAWSGEGEQVINRVTDRTSMLENKSIGSYNRTVDPLSKFHKVVLPPGARRNDLIVSLRGARVPFVVRPMVDSHVAVEMEEAYLFPLLRAGFDLLCIEDPAFLGHCKLVGECLVNEYEDSLCQAGNEWETIAFH